MVKAIDKRVPVFQYITQNQVLYYLSQDVERLNAAVAGGGVRVVLFPLLQSEAKYGLGRDESNIPVLLLLA